MNKRFISFWSQIPAPLLYGLSFLLVIAARIRAELQIGQAPIGADSSSSYIVSYLTHTSSFWESVTSFNFLYYIYSGLRALNIDALVGIKAMAVAIFAFLVVGFFLILKEVLAGKKALVTSGIILFGLQLSTLRFSWDLHRNELALGFLLWSSWAFYRYLSSKKVAWLGLALVFFLLILGTHQMVSLAAVLLIIIFGIQRLSDKIISRPLLRLLPNVIFILCWVLLAPHINIGSYELWVHNSSPTDFHTASTYAFGLFYLLFSPLIAPLAFIGITKTKPSGLLFFTILLLLQSFSEVLWPHHGFYLWDRWMYFLGVPFAIYALIGLQHIAGLRWLRSIPAALIYACIITLALAPSTDFLRRRKTLYGKHVNSAIFNLFPGSMITNIYIANDFERSRAQNLLPCLNAFSAIDDLSSAIVFEPRYYGILYYALPKAHSRFLPSTTLPQQSAPYYQVTYGEPGPNATRLAELEPTCPIFLVRP